MTTRYLITCTTNGCRRFGKPVLYVSWTRKQIKQMGLDICTVCYQAGKIEPAPTQDDNK